MTKREEAKDLYLSALRGDVAAQRTCTANGKPCGGRCIPKHWNCRILGEGETPPTRGNRVELTPEVRARLETRRASARNNTLKTALGLTALTAGAAGLGAWASSKGVSSSSVSGAVSTAAGLITAANPSTALPAALAAAGAGLGSRLYQQGKRGERFKAQITGLGGRVNANLKRIKQYEQEIGANERKLSSLMNGIANATSAKEVRRLQAEADVFIKMLDRDKRRVKNLRESTPRTIRVIERAKRRAQPTIGRVLRTAVGEVNQATSTGRRIRSERGQLRRNLGLTSSGKPGPKATDWVERYTNLDADGKPCGASSIAKKKRCTKGQSGSRDLAKTVAAAALVGGGAAALRGLMSAKPEPAQGEERTNPWVASSGRRMTANEVKALRKMRGMGEGGYGALPRRRRGGRADAAGEKRLGKPCGNSYISREYKCSVSTSGRGQDWGKAAMMVGAVAGGAVVAHELRRRSGDWWKDHKWDTSAEQVEKEFQEAVAGGQKWDEFERRKAAYEAACAKTDSDEQKPEDSSVQQLDLDLGKRKAPARLDGWRKANSCRGSGAFGSYYVHTSGKFGLKAFSDPDYDSQPEADMLEHANRIGVPSPRLMGYTGSVMKLEHLRGYKAVDSTNFGMGMQFGRDIPVEIKKNFIAVVRTMHLEGMAHNDLHMGNIMVGLASRRVKLIDFGLASLRSDTENAVPFRDGRGSNLLKEELSSIPYKLNLPDATTNLVQTRYKRALQLVEDIADSENGYGRARNRSGINLHWDTAEFIINRYYNDLTRAVEAQPVARSRSVASIIQPKLPGFDRARLKARWNTEQAAGLQGWGKDALYDIAQQMGVAPSAFESFLLSAKNKK